MSVIKGVPMCDDNQCFFSIVNLLESVVLISIVAVATTAGRLGL